MCFYKPLTQQLSHLDSVGESNKHRLFLRHRILPGHDGLLQLGEERVKRAGVFNHQRQVLCDSVHRNIHSGVAGVCWLNREVALSYITGKYITLLFIGGRSPKRTFTSSKTGQRLILGTKVCLEMSHHDSAKSLYL